MKSTKRITPEGICDIRVMRIISMMYYKYGMAYTIHNATYMLPKMCVYYSCPHIPRIFFAKIIG